MNTDERATQIVQAIEKDLRDRRGLRQEWENIDEDIQTEIRHAWWDLIVKLLEREP